MERIRQEIRHGQQRFAGCTDFAFAGRAARMAVQPELGILSERSFRDRSVGLSGPAVTGLFVTPESIQQLRKQNIEEQR